MNPDRLIIPDEFEPAIVAFASDVAGTLPIRFPVVPDKHAKLLSCGENVKRVVNANGGEAVKGWHVWWAPGILIEAQAHVVLRRLDSSFIDVTPNAENEIEIVFFADPSMEQNPGFDYIPTIQKNLLGHPLIDDYIALVRVVADQQDLAYVESGRFFPTREYREWQALKKQTEALIAKLEKQQNDS